MYNVNSLINNIKIKWINNVSKSLNFSLIMIDIKLMTDKIPPAKTMLKPKSKYVDSIKPILKIEKDKPKERFDNFSIL